MNKNEIPWGIKAFVLCGTGLVYNFLVYHGKNTSIQNTLKKEYGLEAEIVLELAKIMPSNHNFKLYFDNFFTSLSLISKLQDRKIHSAKFTIRKNQKAKCPLEVNKDIKKNEKGTIDELKEKFDNLVVVKWVDNSVVQLASCWERRRGINKWDR